MSASPESPAEAAPPRTLKRRVVRDPPEMAAVTWGRVARFLLVLGLSAAAAMLAVGAFNTLADPYGTIGLGLLPTATTSDRTIKADALERLDGAPQVVILGSSRSMRWQPAYLGKKTGLRAFNGGVNGIGGTADAWAMANFVHERFPDSQTDYLWLVDVEAFVPFKVQGRTANEPRLAKYVGEATTSRAPASLLRSVAQNRSTMFSWVTARDSMRVILEREQVARKARRYRDSFLPDGGLKLNPWSEKQFKRRYAHSVTRYRNLYNNVYKSLDAEAQRYLERTLRFMNANGAKPVLVLTPINPKLREVLAPLGWDTRRRQVLAYLDSLHGTYDFTFLDLTDIATFGGDPEQFHDGVHMTEVNSRRAMDHILSQTGGFPR